MLVLSVHNFEFRGAEMKQLQDHKWDKNKGLQLQVVLLNKTSRLLELEIHRIHY